ncbi:MAG: hypothetical protein JWP20_2847 [Roseomonas sp.]|nr:hypothetical protein [Roseomonas sp.]
MLVVVGGIAAWMLVLACGKPNRGIGDVPVLSHRTVDKPLEGIHAKSGGVENRVSATALAAGCWGDDKGRTSLTAATPRPFGERRRWPGEFLPRLSLTPPPWQIARRCPCPITNAPMAGPNLALP